MKLVPALLLLASLAAAQAPKRDLFLETQSRSLALVIGNQKYPKFPLVNPANDARAMSATLQELGFQVDLVEDASLLKLELAVKRFVAQIRKGDVALFYYAGHGIQIEGENYLVPVDFDAANEVEAKHASYSASKLHDLMDLAGARLNIVVLDACRNNPFRATRSTGNGLAMMSTGRGTLIAFATSPGKTADDNPSGANGLFTAHLIKSMKEPGLTLDQVFNRVRERVYSDSKERQLPWTQSSVIGEFYFRPAGGTNPLVRNALTEAAPAPVHENPLARTETRNEPRARVLPEGARQAYDRGDTEEAIRLASEILRQEPTQKDALLTLAQSYYRQENFDLFETTAVQALAAGATLSLSLGHHHTLTGGHLSTLTLGDGKLSFDPVDGKQCNQKPIEVPRANVAETRMQTSKQGEVFLNLRVRDAENKLKNFNFADPGSKIDSSSGLPRVVSPPNAARMLTSIGNVVKKYAQAP